MRLEKIRKARELYRKGGMPLRAVAKAVGLSKTVVAEQVKQGAVTPMRPGRPNALPDEAEEMIAHVVRELRELEAPQSKRSGRSATKHVLPNGCCHGFG